MGTQLILTVGTNPLPVWVAWHHLKDKLPKPIKVRLVHTAGTVDEQDRIRKYCQGADFLAPIQTSAGNPGTVRKDIGVILEDLDGINNLHVHYTGGTKVMAVETVAALEYDLPEDIGLDTSYLDPRSNSGPTIVDSNGTHLVSDTRCGVGADLSRIALLNGFTIGPFKYRYWAGKTQTRDCPAPAKLQNKQLRYGANWLDNDWSNYESNRLEYGAYAQETTQNSFDPEKECESKMLEYGAYAALEEALKKISTNNPIRNNYKLFHSVYVRRRAKGKNLRVKPFELDVVAVLGYQIVVVSCSLDSKQEMIKKKGMEAILRARQLGGDEARAIVLCSATNSVTKDIQRELHDEIGSIAPPLEIWSKTTGNRLPNMQVLSGKFEAYLKDDIQWQ